MFALNGVLLGWALVTFGAVLPSTSLLLGHVWFVAVTLLSLWQIIRLGRLDYLLIGALVLGGLSMLFGWPKIALWVFSLLWLWKAARDNPGDVVRYLRFLIWVGIAESFLGLVQYFVAPGWILGYQNLSGSLVSGTLINRNHFAGLLEMLVPCCIGLGFMTVRRYRDASRSYLYVLAGAFMALSLAFSLSRMGIFSFLVMVLFVSMIMVFVKSGRQRILGLGAGLVGLFLVGVLWIGVDSIVKRYSELMGSNAFVEEGRTILFRDTVRMIRTFPNGVGVGRYQDAFRRFQTIHPELLFDHAHNDYLETAAEWGIAAAIAFWVAIGSVFVALVRRLMKSDDEHEEGILLACTAAICAILIHSLADFNLQIPSNGMLFFGFIGIGLGMLLPKRPATGFN
jgi:O-antigen ligase